MRVGQPVTGLRQSENIHRSKASSMQVLDYREQWKSLDWKKFQRKLFGLQVRMFKAMRKGDYKLVLSLQKLILKNRGARFLAIRQVTQLNQGKKTAGIDGKLALDFKERFELERQLAGNTFTWKHSRLREIPIPKKDGTTRMLKVPTIADRAWQCLVKYALEPAHEATFHARSYGFRPGRSCHDCQKLIFSNLNSKAKGKDKQILELDIERCFDQIDHKALIKLVIAPVKIKQRIWQALKAGVTVSFATSINMTREQIAKLRGSGTPQGGVFSPLLANIALNGIENLHPHAIRYADDMVFILREKEDASKLKDKIAAFLATRGLKIKEKKTRLVKATDGFDFLGWHFIVQQNGKFRSFPSEENYQSLKKRVKAIVNDSQIGSTEKVNRLAPLVRGWRNYHKYCKMDGYKLSLYALNKAAWKKFIKEKKLNRYQVNNLISRAFPAVSYSENKFVMVAGSNSPYNGDLVYWAKRNSKLYDGKLAKTIKKQNHSCGICGLTFWYGEKVNLHHIDGNHQNGKTNNLMAAHESCHNYIHMGNTDCRELDEVKISCPDLTERGGR